MNWRGRPLTRHEVIVETIAATTTTSELTVQSELDTNTYPVGVKIPNKQMWALETSGILTRHDFHGGMELHAQPGDIRHVRNGLS